MVNIAEMNVLAVGMEDCAEQFRDLPVQVLNQAFGTDAIRSFKTAPIDSVVSVWHLPDMPGGLFLKRLKAAMPQIPVVAIVQPSDPQQEIEARQLGAAVIPEGCDDAYFLHVLISVFGLSGVRSTAKLHSVSSISGGGNTGKSR